MNDSLGVEDNLTTAIYLGYPSTGNKVSDTNIYTHDFRSEKLFDLYYIITTPLEYSQLFRKRIKLINYNPILHDSFSLNETSYLNTEVELELDVEDPADKPLSYQWLVNDILVESDGEWRSEERRVGKECRL